MAVVQWLGGTSTDVTTGANWSTAAVPSADDTAIWSTVTSYNMSGTFTNAVNLVVTDGAGYGTTTISRDVGTSASPLVLKSNGANRFANRGNVYISGSGTIPTVSLEMPNGGTAVISGGTITTLNATGVNVEIGASAVATNVKNNGATISAATGTAITLLTGSGRTTCTTRNITTAVTSGPAVITTEGTGTVGTIYIASGSTFVHKSSGTTTTAEIFNGGTYTVAGSNASAATLTTANIHKGGTLIEAVPGFTLTVTTKNYVGGQSTPAGSPS